MKDHAESLISAVNHNFIPVNFRAFDKEDAPRPNTTAPFSVYEPQGVGGGGLTPRQTG